MYNPATLRTLAELRRRMADTCPRIRRIFRDTASRHEGGYHRGVCVGTLCPGGFLPIEIPFF